MDGIPDLMADLIETLEPAEREQFSELIEECLARQRAIRQEAVRAEAALEQLLEERGRLSLEVRQVSQSGDHAMVALGRIYLRTIRPPASSH